MIRRAALIAFAVAIAGGLMAATTGTATAAVPGTACSTSTIIDVQSFVFNPPSVPPGGSSVATLTAANCTGQTQKTNEIWFGRFIGSSGGNPSGCPVIDPLPMPATFPPYSVGTASVVYQVPPSCTASELVVTVNIDGQNGTLLGQGTAVLKITCCVARASGSRPERS